MAVIITTSAGVRSLVRHHVEEHIAAFAVSEAERLLNPVMRSAVKVCSVGATVPQEVRTCN
jgi:hypothetical protein